MKSNGKKNLDASKPTTKKNDDKPSFLDLKEKLVTLSLEIEDANRTGELLLTKVNEEKRRRFRLKQEIAAQWGPKLKEAVDEHKKETETQLSKIDNLLQRKKKLSEECREMLEKIKREQAVTQRRIERIRQESEEEIAKAKRSWAEGENVRRERWLARKAKEAKDLTLKGLQPEVEHLMHKHRQDEQRLRDQLQLEIAELQRLMQVKTTEAVEEEKKKLRSKFEEVFRTIKLEENERINEINDDHENHMQILRQRLEKEMTSQRDWQDQELKRLEEKHVCTQSGLRKEEAEALKELRERQRREQDALVARHADDLKAMRDRAKKEREEWRRSARQKVQAEELGLSKQEADKLVQERDNTIDSQIRHLQKKAKEEKREAKADHEEELIHLTEDLEAEAERSRRRCMEYERKLEGCHRAIEIELQKKEVLGSSLASLKDELKDLHKIFQKKRKAFAEQQTTSSQRDAKLLEDQKSVREEIKRKINQAKIEADHKEAELCQMKERHELVAQQIQDEHNEKLNDLESCVRRMMEERDFEIAQMRDKLHTESIKKKRMSKLLEKYSTVKH